MVVRTFVPPMVIPDVAKLPNNIVLVIGSMRATFICEFTTTWVAPPAPILTPLVEELVPSASPFKLGALMLSTFNEFSIVVLVPLIVVTTLGPPMVMPDVATLPNNIVLPTPGSICATFIREFTKTWFALPAPILILAVVELFPIPSASPSIALMPTTFNGVAIVVVLALMFPIKMLDALPVPMFSDPLSESKSGLLTKFEASRLVALAAPMFGVVKLGESLKTSWLPELPVRSEIVCHNCKEVVAANWLSGFAVNPTPGKLAGAVHSASLRLGSNANTSPAEAPLVSTGKE